VVRLLARKWWIPGKRVRTWLRIDLTNNTLQNYSLVPRSTLKNCAPKLSNVARGPEGNITQVRGNISPIWGEAPTVPIETKICMMGDLADVITYAEFQDEIFRGYDFTGDRLSHFPVDFCMGLTTAALLRCL